ncbi:MAG: acyltransferase [Phascolarctobacterium sp.]|uniref:acyltransferase n=1 Tax=Phascolarctobacterium sp. TaxID=2049039 RepID=UPI0025ED0371|nr:acyltransferase [Phascolarctobacterium sp.]MCC8159229.1 acyltransferase [Phascolarctobacterium sp.]
MPERNQIIDDLRGICMLGVIGIHVGSFVLESPQPNSFLYMLLEILSRYSVPAFFFISGYGLFCHYRPESHVAYLPFLKKRLQSVGIPYVVWSLLYLLYFSAVMPGCISWQPGNIAFLLFYGLSCYHLYFMVILLWFYFTFPLWHKLFAFFQRGGLKLGFALLFFLQITFNYWTCHPNINSTELPLLLQNLFNYRLNYLPLHYLFIFMLGGLAAIYYNKFIKFITSHFTAVNIFYIFTLFFIGGSYYYYYFYYNYSLIILVNTFQQLSLQGFLYTIASLLFFCAVFSKTNLNNPCRQFIHLLSVNSLIVYLIHPFWMDIINRLCHAGGIVMTSKRILAIYFLLVALSVFSSILLTKLGSKFPHLALLLTGKRPKTNTF